MTGYQPIRDQYFLNNTLILSFSLQTTTPTDMSWASLKQYMMSTVLEDSAHYVLFAFNFYGYKPNQELLVPDWLITSHVTYISFDWLFT